LRPRPFNYVLRETPGTAYWDRAEKSSTHPGRMSGGLKKKRRNPGEDEDVQTMIDEDAVGIWSGISRPAVFETRRPTPRTHGLVRGEYGHPRQFARLVSGTDLVRDAKNLSLLGAFFSGPGPHIEPDIDDVGFVEHQRQK